MEENPLVAKTLDFSVRIVNLYKCLRDERHETVMSKQIIRSGTSIGANASEAIAAESMDDFVHKLTISLKEANETKYWILLLHRTQYIREEEYKSIMTDCQELRKLIGSIISSTKRNRRKE
ncbi:MAG: four helix bundle protein [Bacteroidaceae bacterium]|nr:four helix bundle protein [Bacteroidaceae bacterium]